MQKFFFLRMRDILFLVARTSERSETGLTGSSERWEFPATVS